MPLIYIDVFDRRSQQELEALLEAIHNAVVEAFEVPSRDRYQVLTQHRPGELVIQDTGLGIDRTDAVVIVHIVSRKRTDDQKTRLYRLLAENLGRDCDLPTSDLMVSITENSAADWSFAHGRAQFLTAEL
ncbi:tautomerase family protein [Amycolatopsis nivea]|uniref:tautomerase family protein n=1 Tax=Amycolatopsis nivea TaxID=1644109 RepID=UPI00106F15FF|nr:tautomerase family protein [Amycolatopsis nivea]